MCSFIEEFLALASPTDDGEKTQQKEEKVEVNERHDKIFWTDDELYQLKVSDNYLSKESPRKARLQQFHNSKASKNLAAINGMESKEASLVERSRIETPLTPASDRQMAVRETVSREVVEERYTQLVLALPGRIEEAEVVIRKTVATQRMLGYTFVVSFVMAAIFDTIGLILFIPKNFTQAVSLIFTNKYHG